jgi:glycolate oxidase FAD binding subunit
MIDTRSLTQVVDFPARDMTITVQTGITIQALQQHLASENQRLPIDVPRADRATLGGSMAANVSGSRRFGFGTLRDYVIGITVLDDQGREAKAGGRVVKNVAGYDLCKLHIGAFGTLGIITQATLKLWPRLSSRALLTLGCAADDLAKILDHLQETRTRPVCIDVLNAAACSRLPDMGEIRLPNAPWVVVVGYEESEPCVNWQVQQILREIAASPLQGLQALAGKASDPLWAALVEAPLDPETQLHFKANLLSSAVAPFCLQASQLEPALRLQAHAGNGIVHGHADGLTLESARTLIDTLTTTAASARGNVLVAHAPPAWKPQLPLWGRPRADQALMRQIVHRLDPQRLFNPGRFLDRL